MAAPRCAHDKIMLKVVLVLIVQNFTKKYASYMGIFASSKDKVFSSVSTLMREDLLTNHGSAPRCQLVCINEQNLKTFLEQRR